MVLSGAYGEPCYLSNPWGLIHYQQSRRCCYIYTLLSSADILVENCKLDLEHAMDHVGDIVKDAKTRT